MLSHTDAKLLTAVLRAVGNIATGNDQQTQAILDHGALQFMTPLLTHNKDRIAKVICFDMYCLITICVFRKRLGSSRTLLQETSNKFKPSLMPI
jgi:hypothetical protein